MMMNDDTRSATQLDSEYVYLYQDHVLTYNCGLSVEKENARRI